MKTFHSFLLGCAVLMPTHAANAQEADSVIRTRGDDDFHGRIVVTAGLRQLDILAGTSVVEGSELQRNLAGQVGDVLAKLPGVTTTSFSPGASRPVLRGFSGERVRVLVDGIGAIDVSNTSADHAVTIDPLTADRIEVLRGPAVMLYGSQAIGGAVNVIDKRIPPRVPDESVHFDAVFGLDSAADKREAGASFDVPLGTNVAFHVDGSWRKTGDLEIPGFVLSDTLRSALLAGAAEEEGEGHFGEAEELREAADMRGVLPNSWTETYSLGSGIAFFSGDSNIGISAGYYDTSYGVPTGPGMEHHHEEGDGPHEEEEGAAPVTIGMMQYRADLRGTLDLRDGFFDELRTRWGYSDYTHTEFEGEEIGTIFDVHGVEGRVELVQNRRGSWGGTIGAQFYHRDFKAAGAEAFVPENITDQYAIFALQEVSTGPVDLEFAARYERSEIDAPLIGQTRSYNSLSGALGLAHETADGLRFGINLSRAERAPSAEELFADGPHIATQQYELGDPALKAEKAWGVEAFVRGRLGPAKLSVAIFKSWFSDYVYLAATGLEEDGLPVFQQRQADARYFGIEGEVDVPLYDIGPFSLNAELRGDLIRAELADGTPLPRIPPLSLLGALEASWQHLDARAEVQWSDKQTRLAPLETPTNAFTQVNLSLAWHPLDGAKNLTLMLQADNIFNVEARRHASFTKDFVPLAGRNFKLSARASF